MNELLEQLGLSEKANQDIMQTNSALRDMLHELEDKSQKISQLAKEKVLKYVDLNKSLQLTVDELTSKLKSADMTDGASVHNDVDVACANGSSSVDNSNEVAKLKEELREAKDLIEELQGRLHKVEQPSDGSQEPISPATDSPILKMKFGYEKLQERIQNGSDVDSIHKGKLEKSELETRLSELEADNAKLCNENRELNGVIVVKNKELSELQQDLAGVKGVLLHLEKNIDSPEVQVDNTCNLHENI